MKKPASNILHEAVWLFVGFLFLLLEQEHSKFTYPFLGILLGGV